MTEIVKRDRVKHCAPHVGDRVSVKKDYFDSDSTNPYSAALPDHITRLLGTVIFVYDGHKKVRVHWDVDKTKNDVKVEELTIESADKPVQSFELPESSVDVPKEAGSQEDEKVSNSIFYQ